MSSKRQQWASKRLTSESTVCLPVNARVYAYACARLGRKRDETGSQYESWWPISTTEFSPVHDEPLQLGGVRYTSGTISPVGVVGGPCKGSCDDGAESSSICRRVPSFSPQTIASRLWLWGLLCTRQVLSMKRNIYLFLYKRIYIYRRYPLSLSLSSCVIFCIKRYIGLS